MTTRVIYRGRVIRVQTETVRRDGRRLTYEVVRHRGSVVLLAQPAPREIFLIRQYRHVIGRRIWELPAGSLDPGEAPGPAARRECAEEIGWRPRRIERLASLYPTPGFCDERMVFYRCTDLRRPGRGVMQDPDEEIEPRVFTLAEARRLVARGAIVDMKTVVGLTLID